MTVFNEPSTLDADYSYGSNDEFNFLREVFAGSNLNSKERQLLMSVEQGDLETVRRLLQSVSTITESDEDEDEDAACDVQSPPLTPAVSSISPFPTPTADQKVVPSRTSRQSGMNINCVDPRGRTSVMIAIDNENIEMLDLLLKHGLDTADAIKHAVMEQNVAAVELLLNTDSANRRNAVHSSSFSSDVTCLMLAAHLDNYELINLLLHYGDRLVRPHDVMCQCYTCKQQSGDDFLNSSLSRFHLYQALASPYLIVLTSRDPLLTAFRLSGELKRLSLLENEFHEDYKALATRCDNFAVDMLDQVRGLSDLEVILNFSPTHYAGDSRHYDLGDTDAEDSDSDDERDLKRFRVAIQYKQKKFVAHPNCQQLIAARWYDGLPGYRRRNDVTRLLTMATIGLLHPLFCIFYTIWPCGAIGHFLRRPFVNCICHGASYLVFVFFIIVASQRFDFIGYVMALSEDAQQRRMVRDVQGPPPTFEEWIIMVYVIGFVASQVRELWDIGVRSFIRDMWSVLDCLTNSLYIATFTLKFIAYYRAEQLSDVYGNIPRKDWGANDPNLIAEGLFAVANIFSALKILQVFNLHPKLGPLQISLGRMILDITRFGAIALLVALAYAFGINQLYWYYSEAQKVTCFSCQNRTDDSNVDDSCLEACDKSLDSLFEIIQTLYFAIYGLVDRRTFEVRENHTYTQFIGRLMFGSYCGIMVVVLLNMLVAILSNSFQNIWDDADTEWKYARSKFWISYFRRGVVLPPPYNLIPTPLILTYVYRGLDLVLRALCATKLPFTSSKICIKTPKSTKEAEYQAVMEKLVRRYVNQRQKEAMSSAITIDDISEVKQDISAMRHELLGVLRTNGFKVPSTAVRTGQLGGKRRGAMSLNRLFQAGSAGHAPLAVTQSGSSLNTPTSVTFIDDSPFKRRLSSQQHDSRANKSRRVSFS